MDEFLPLHGDIFFFPRADELYFSESLYFFLLRYETLNYSFPWSMVMALKLTCRWLLRNGLRRRQLDSSRVVVPALATTSNTSKTIPDAMFAIASPRPFSISTTRSSLMDFFDDQANWDKEEMKGGPRHLLSASVVVVQCSLLKKITFSIVCQLSLM